MSGNELRAVRWSVEPTLLQTELAEAAGLDRAVITALERQEVMLAEDVMRRLFRCAYDMIERDIASGVRVYRPGQPRRLARPRRLKGGSAGG